MRFRLVEENALNDPVVQEVVDTLPEDEEDIVETILSMVDMRPEIIKNPNDVTRALDEALDIAIDALDYGRETAGAAANVLLVGGAGTGKTSIVKQWAKKRHINLVQKNASSFDKSDMGGGVAREVDSKGIGTNRMTRLTNVEFDKLQQPGSVLFLDELNRADPEVVGSLLTLILDHKVPDNYSEGGMKLLRGYLFTVAAINPADDEAYGGTNEFDNALLDRFRQIPVYADVAQYRNHLLDELNGNLQKDLARLQKDPSSKRNKDKVLATQGRIKLATTILNSPLFAFDDIEDEKKAQEKREDNPILQGKILSPRGFSALIRACDGTKESFLKKWPDFCNYNKLSIMEDILDGYVDVDDKANRALRFQYDEKGNLLGDEKEEQAPEIEDFFTNIEMDL